MLARDEGRAVFAAIAPRKPLPEIEEPPVDDTPMPTSLEEYGLSADAEREDMATPEPSIPGSTAKPKFVPIAIDDVTVAAEPAWLIGRPSAGPRPGVHRRPAEVRQELPCL